MLPNAERAIIDLHKITGYLLNPRHPDGASKAQFFARFGFALDKPDALADALREHARGHPARKLKRTAYGVTYAVDGPLPALDGRTPQVRSVWIVLEGEGAPRLVTAFPARKDEE